MSYVIEEIQYKGHTIRIKPDENAESPRGGFFDNVGTILYTSTRYTLGDKQVDRDEITAIANDPDNIVLPVYAYIHSGIRLSTGPFSCPWDSGQCGIIYCTKARAVKEWGKKLCTQTVIEKAKRYLEGEIETFNQYLSGEVVGYTVEGPLCEDSCWGFYPDEKGGYDYAISEAKAAIDYDRKVEAKRLREERLNARLAREQHLALL